jgi:hypothetical protein
MALSRQLGGCNSAVWNLIPMFRMNKNQKMSRESSDDVLLHEVLQQQEPPREIATSSRKLIF